MASNVSASQFLLEEEIALGSAFGRVVAGGLGLGLAYLTAAFLVWTGWSSTDTAADWIRGNVVLLAASAVCGVGAALLLVGALLSRRPPAVVVVLGLAPAVVAILAAPLRY